MAARKSSKKAAPQETRGAAKVASAKRKTPAKRASATKTKGGAKASSAKAGTFPSALAKLLRSRRLKVPAGLKDAPPEAYAKMPASAVKDLEGLSDDALSERAEKIAGFAERQAQRAKQSWESSPLVAEIRRRKLRAPSAPKRVVGAAFSLKKPLGDWTDEELLEAAREWSSRGRE